MIAKELALSYLSVDIDDVLLGDFGPQDLNINEGKIIKDIRAQHALDNFIRANGLNPNDVQDQLNNPLYFRNPIKQNSCTKQR